MNQAPNTRVPYVTIFHPSDFSPASEAAFCHALKIALLAKARLQVMHVAATEFDMNWTDFPGVRSSLARWGILPEGTSRQEVGKVGLDVEKNLHLAGVRLIQFYATSNAIPSI